MIMMKKIVVLLLSAAMMLSMTACGGAGNPKPGDGNANQEAPSFDNTEAVINAIYEIKAVDLSMMSIPVDLTDEYSLSAYTGLTPDDADKLVEATASEPMMGQACSIVVAELTDASNTADIAQKMANGIDQRKWVCMEADTLRVVTCDKYVLLVMIDSELSEGVTVDEIVDAFTQVCGFTDGEYSKQ